jgi:phospholipase C
VAGRAWGLDEHARRTELSRRRVLQGMLAGAAVTAAGAGVSQWVTQGPARAAGLVLPPGTRPDPARPEGVDTMPQIEHIVIYMQENHSFDSYFGMLGRGDGFTLGPGGVPTNWNPDQQDDPFPVFHSPSTCDPVSGDHGWNAEHVSCNGGAMDGFIKASDSTNVMGYFDGTDLPFYYGLAGTFPICDRWFCSVMGPTHPNRRYLQAGTSVGIVQTSIPEVLATPTAPNGTIWDRLDAHGISWANYAIDLWDCYLFPTADLSAFAARTLGNRRYFQDFLDDCLYDRLPQVSLISPGTQEQYDEGSRDVQNGEAYSYSIITAVMESPAWDKTAIFFCYDENGGCYDHVPPPAAVAPDNIAPRITVPPDQPGDFAQLGPRVPGIVISPFAKANYVSSVVRDHTAVLKFIETKFNLGALTYRDANADDLLDVFDFAHPAFRDPPTLPAPGLPDAGSACQLQPRPATNAGRTTTTTTSTPSTPSTPAPATTSTTSPGGTGVAAPPGSAAVPNPVVVTPRFTG